MNLSLQVLLAGGNPDVTCPSGTRAWGHMAASVHQLLQMSASTGSVHVCAGASSAAAASPEPQNSRLYSSSHDFKTGTRVGNTGFHHHH